MGYYLQDNPNKSFGQYGWLRTKVSGVMGVHTTESGVDFEGPDPGVENTANYLRTRTTPGSYHVMADWDSILQLIHPRYAAWADVTNNAHAMSVSGAMNAARWRDLEPSRAAQIVRNMGKAAAMVVRDAMNAGLLAVAIPARRITADEAIKGTKMGFYGHGETNPGRRYDPGTNFDWNLFLSSYASAIGGGLAAQGTITEEDDDMPTAKDVAKETVALLMNHPIARQGPGMTGELNFGAFLAWSDANFKGITENTVHGVLHGEIPWAGFDGNIPTEGRNTTTLATAAAYEDASTASTQSKIAVLEELVRQLAVKQGVVIDYDLIADKVAKASADEQAKRLAE